MKRLLIVVALALFLGLSGTAMAANSGSAMPSKVNILNNANFDIYTLAVSPTNANQWESQTLEQKVLPNGDTVDLMMAQTPSAKAWDLKVSDKNGNSMTWIGLPINPKGQITLLPDGEFLVNGKAPKAAGAMPASGKNGK